MKYLEMIIKAKECKQTLKELIKLMMPLVYKCSMGLLDHEDAKSELMLCLIASIKKYDPKTKVPPLGYLKSMLNYRRLEIIRERKLIPLEEIEPSGSSSLEYELLELRREILKLPKLQRNVMILYYYHDVPLKEIANRYKLDYSKAYRMKRDSLNYLAKILN